MSDEEDNLFLTEDYIKKSYEIVAEALKNGNEVLHMPNGDIHITETKKVTTHYKWDEKAKKMIRATSSSSYMKKKLKNETDK